MLAAYTNWTNLDARYERPYLPGDRLVKGWTGTIEAPVTDEGVVLTMHALEAVFCRHNGDDRPDGQLCPSLSKGDVVILGGEAAYSVDRVGFVAVAVDRADLITDRTWAEVA